MGLLPRALVRLVVVVWVMASAAEAAEKVTVFGDAGKGSGRLEFNWPRAVLYDVRVILGRLVVQFSEPGDFDFSAYRHSMPQYLGNPTVVADGAVIAFPLRIPVTLRHRQEGPRITIELHDEHALPELSTAAGDSPQAAEPLDGDPADPPAADGTEAAVEPLEAPPIETHAGPPDGPPLGLRVGEHPGFSRLVFDWPSEVAYRIEQRGDRVTIDFDATAELDVSKFEHNGLDNVYAITSETGEIGLRVTLFLTEDWLVRHFRSGTFVAVDVVHDEERAARIASAQVVEPTPPSEPPAQLAEEPAPAAAPLAAVSQKPLPASAQQVPESASEPGGGTRLAAIEPPEPLPDAAEPPAGEAVEPAAEPVTEAGAGPDLVPAPERPEIAAINGAGVLSLAEVRELEGGDPASDPGTQVGARKPVLLRFDWPLGPGRAAAFRRGRHLWIVFDQPVAAGAARRIAETVPDLAPVARLTAENAPEATVLRLNLPAGFVPALRRDDNAWIVDLRPRPEKPQTALTLEYQTEAPDPRIRFKVGGTQEVLRVRDPDLGDRLEIVPVPVAGQGLDRPRHFLQFRALATYQGLAFIPLSDGLAVEAGEGGVVVRDATGLLVSPGADRDRKLRDSNDFESG